MLSGSLVFAWGCAGGAATAAFLFLLPKALAVWDEDDAEFRFTRKRVVAGLTVLAILTLVAGLVALAADANDRRHAILFGFESQAILRGFLGAGEKALSGKKDEDVTPLP